jgi:hypothetical protein
MGPGPAGIVQAQQLILRLINVSVYIAFMILTVMLVYGGFLYLTSGGDTKELGKAHTTMTWALLGVLFLALAWLILRLIEAFTGVQVTIFCLGFPRPGDANIANFYNNCN